MTCSFSIKALWDTEPNALVKSENTAAASIPDFITYQLFLAAESAYTVDFPEQNPHWFSERG